MAVIYLLTERRAAREARSRAMQQQFEETDTFEVLRAC